MNTSYNEYKVLIIKAQEGALSDEEKTLLNELIKSPENQKIYFEMIKTNYALMQLDMSEYQNSIISMKNSNFDMQMWQQLAREEKMADTVNLPVSEELTPIIQSIPRQEVVFKISRRSLFTLIMAVAAIVFILVFIRFTPPATGFKVAVLSDSINAKWVDMNNGIKKGASLLTSRECLILREGVVELLFDNQAKVVIEAPAEFALLTGDQIKLQYGRIFAQIPREAIGFAIVTPTARVIDLGTKFGVSADISGDTSLYVMQGRTTLIAGDKSSKISMDVEAGKAKKVSGLTQAISDIMFHKDLFVQNIDSGKNLIWRGQTEINLADIVGGGNGFGTGLVGSGIDTQTGNYVRQFNVQNYSEGTPGYLKVDSSPFIDGVFVPDGGNGPVQVSSQGDIFADCPDTNGQYWVGIKDGGTHSVAGQFNDHVLTLLGVPYDDSSKRPAIFIHANQGITFDMAKIRESLPEVEIKEFTATCGLSDSIYDVTSDYSRNQTQDVPTGDFWVLVDGQIRFSKTRQCPTDSPVSINIPIQKQDRFLTILVTDSNQRISYVWSLYAEPVLHIEGRQ